MDLGRYLKAVFLFRGTIGIIQAIVVNGVTSLKKSYGAEQTLSGCLGLKAISLIFPEWARLSKL